MAKEPRKVFVTQIFRGGGLNFGEAMYADCDIASGDTVRLVFPYDTMDDSVFALFEFTGVVNAQRLQRGELLREGFTAQGLHVGPSQDGRSVALQLGLQLGLRKVSIPAIDVSAEESRQLAALLLKWADQVDPPKPAE
jgi:hypothetical protein